MLLGVSSAHSRDSWSQWKTCGTHGKWREVHKVMVGRVVLWKWEKQEQNRGKGNVKKREEEESNRSFDTFSLGLWYPHFVQNINYPIRIKHTVTNSPGHLFFVPPPQEPFPPPTPSAAKAKYIRPWIFYHPQNRLKSPASLWQGTTFQAWLAPGLLLAIVP